MGDIGGHGGSMHIFSVLSIINIIWNVMQGHPETESDISRESDMIEK